MATEKATDTTATQNPAPSPKAPARARATRAKTSAQASSTPLEPTSTTTITATPATSPDAPAPKSPRAKASTAKKPAPRKRASKSAKPEAMGEASVELALLEKEASKSLLSSASPKAACKAHCGQCGREMRFVPFTLSNLMCRSCYGLDRYRRPTSPSLSSLTAPRPSGPR